MPHSIKAVFEKMDKILYYSLTAFAVLFTLAAHEFAHAYTAYRLGDGTARSLGRLTLNPLKHLDPVGAICMLLFHVGWAKPVPINARNFKNPKRDFALTAVAGPILNILLAFIFAFLYLLTLSLANRYATGLEGFARVLLENFILLLFIFHSVNIGLGIFNLIPIPPFDGSRLLNVIFPPRIYFGIMRHERKIYWGVLAWLLLGDRVKYMLLSIPAISSSPILSTIVGVFSLSDMLGVVIETISGWMFDLWQLIPFLA